MKIAYMPDTHGGPYNQPEPSANDAARFCDQLLAEGIDTLVLGCTHYPLLTGVISGIPNHQLFVGECFTIGIDDAFFGLR